jgi:hypothetical protein
MNPPTPRHSTETTQINSTPVQAFEAKLVRVRPGDSVGPRLGRPVRPDASKPADAPSKD